MVGRDPRPHHDGASAVGDHFLDTVRVVLLASLPADLATLVRVAQSEPTLVGEEHTCPLNTCPARMLRRKGSSSSFVGSSVLWALVRDAGMELCLV